ncbi:Dyp-type peroxidase [Phytohabitans sp. ZYX-F-186]|uniref:Dyp-type peroxidase n=1 Tax=Phytohabitans maris TaxID=3071409 RepID=A0ABU0ZWW3_9ACTN|nr:Dyp-type peroxidase [Phytohabitans sp. ZYX-F-186]MDQ7910997.1 Dyp-type peroxidase [Phytohabitans sp. ZYX-F-186]
MGGAAGLAIGATASCRRGKGPHDTGSAPTIPFHGGRQAGVDTPPQTHALVVGYALAPGVVRDQLVRALGDWTTAASAMTSGRSSEPALAGTSPARLTITVGFSGGLFKALGLAPAPGMVDLPAFPGDRLDPNRTGADVGVQLCADDPMQLAGAAAVLNRLADGVLLPRWQRLGLRPTRQVGTPRNLFGFKDGTANPTDLDRHVWRPDGSTFLVVRQIRMDVPKFTALPLPDQEAVIGRSRESGAPLGARVETDEVDLFARTDDGAYVIPATAHVRAAHPRFDGGAEMLRRGYTYVDGAGEVGLLFLAFMRDPELFVRVQRRLSAVDGLRHFTETRGSALFWIPPGVAEGDWIGSALLG